MSRYLVRVLVCDKPLCTARFVHDAWATKRLVPLTVLRHTAREQGWKRGRDGRDYCPNHTPWPGSAAWALGPSSEDIASADAVAAVTAGGAR